MGTYIKFNASDAGAGFVYCAMQEFTDEGKGPKKVVSIPLGKFLEDETDFTLLDGPCHRIYLEEPLGVYEKHFLDGSIAILSEEEQNVCRQIVDRAMNGSYDELLKPPSVDEQVDAFIKDFFEETDAPIKQKDFLEEFFNEIEQNK